MTTPCERADDIQEIKMDIKEQGKDIKLIIKHQHENTIDIVKLKAESKRSGGIWGAVASIIIAIASVLSTKLGA